MRKRYKFATEKDNSTFMMVIAALVVLILLVGIGIFITMPEEEQKTVEYRDENVKEEIIVEECDEQCQFQNAILERNVELCKTLTNESKQQECFETLAEEDLEACLLVKDESKKNFCVLGFAQTNITICEYSNQREECKSKVDSCYNSENYALCDAIRKEDPSLCEEDSCLFEYATTIGNSAACLMIENNIDKRACESIVLNKDQCYLLEASERDYCYLKYAIDTGKSQFCYDIRSDTIPRKECITFFAISFENKEMCEDLILNDRWKCYRNYALETGDLEACESIHSLATTNRFKCAFEYAKKYKDPSACEIIESTASKTTCYAGILIHQKEVNPEKCADVVDIEWRYKCYTVAAINEDNPRYCNNIDREAERNSCVANYNKAISETEEI